MAASGSSSRAQRPGRPPPPSLCRLPCPDDARFASLRDFSDRLLAAAVGWGGDGLPCRHHGPGATAQPRGRGPHRRGQDHRQRADPLLRRGRAQDRPGRRGHRRHGLDARGARARDHDHRGGDDPALARARPEPDRHARARRLHHRGRALHARAGRRGARDRRRGRGAGPVGSGLAPDAAPPRARPGLRQQVRPRRARTSWARSTSVRRRLGAPAVPVQYPL